MADGLYELQEGVFDITVTERFAYRLLLAGSSDEEVDRADRRPSR